MKESIIIPIRDLGKKLVRCLDSIAVQDFAKSDYEVLCVFDSCTDDSEKTVQMWHTLHRDVCLRLFRCDCKCPGGARNVGLDNAVGDYIMFVDGDDWLMYTSAMTILYDAVQGHNAVRVMDHGVRGNMVKYSERLTIWLHFFSRALIGDDRFSDMLLCEDYEFVKRIRNKPEYDEAIVTTPLYFYEYDDVRMKNRIKTVVAASKERAAQGLPRLYVSDGFIPEGARKALEKWRSS